MSAISAIRKALEDGFARGDEESLAEFYDALLAGEVLVVLGAGEAALALTLAGADAEAGPGGGPGAAIEVGGLRDAEGQPVLAAFTGDEEIETWAGWGAGRLAVPVGALAAAALDAGVHELALNPAGPIGRRLDVVELRQLAAGLRPRHGRASFGFDPRSGIALAAPADPPGEGLVHALRSVCAHNGDVVTAYLVELMQPRRAAAADLAIALELDGPAAPERREALVELIGAVVTGVPDSGLDGVGFLWLDARLAGIARSRVRPAYAR